MGYDSNYYKGEEDKKILLEKLAIERESIINDRTEEVERQAELFTMIALRRRELAKQKKLE